MIYQLVNKRTEILVTATSLIAQSCNYYNHAFALLISMPRLIALTFIKIGLILNYFCQKYTKFSSTGGSTPRPP